MSCFPDRATEGTESTVQAQVALVGTAKSEDLPRTLRANGTLHGAEESTLAAEVSGRVIEIVHDLGDRVRAGDTLVRIDPTGHELARQERERALQQILASLGVSEIPKADFDVDSLPSVERAALESANAKTRHERARQFISGDPPLISEQDFEDLATAADVAQSGLRVARLNALARIAEARTLETQIRQAERRLRECTVRAPEMPSMARDAERVYEVARRRVAIGDFVQIGAPLFELVIVDPLILRLRLPERSSGDLRVDLTATVRLDGRPEVHVGKVTRISPAVDPATRTFLIEVTVANAERRLKPGSFAVADIEVGRIRALVLPVAAVATFAGIDKVFLAVDGKAVERRVVVGDRLDGFVEIRSGITADDRVVLNPGGTLVTGVPLVEGDGATRPSGAPSSAGPAPVR